MKLKGLKLKVKFDRKSPDGTPKKVLDTSIAKNYGWLPKVDLSNGFFKTYEDFLKTQRIK